MTYEEVEQKKLAEKLMEISSQHPRDIVTGQLRFEVMLGMMHHLELGMENLFEGRYGYGAQVAALGCVNVVDQLVLYAQLECRCTREKALAIWEGIGSKQKEKIAKLIFNVLKKHQKKGR